MAMIPDCEPKYEIHSSACGVIFTGSVDNQPYSENKEDGSVDITCHICGEWPIAATLNPISFREDETGYCYQYYSLIEDSGVNDVEDGWERPDPDNLMAEVREAVGEALIEAGLSLLIEEEEYQEGGDEYQSF